MISLVIYPVLALHASIILSSDYLSIGKIAVYIRLSISHLFISTSPLTTYIRRKYDFNLFCLFPLKTLVLSRNNKQLAILIKPLFIPNCLTFKKQQQYTDLNFHGLTMYTKPNSIELQFKAKTRSSVEILLGQQKQNYPFIYAIVH